MKLPMKYMVIASSVKVMLVATTQTYFSFSCLISVGIANEFFLLANLGNNPELYSLAERFGIRKGSWVKP